MKKTLMVVAMMLGAGSALGDTVTYRIRLPETVVSVDMSVDATRITKDTVWLYGGGWYYVDGDVEVDHHLLCNGNTENPAHIILMDGSRLVLRGADGYPGLYAGVGSKLEIYGQRLGAGKLIAYGGANAPGIGGAAFSNSTICGTIIVHGGNVEAHGGANAPGIGGAYMSGSAGWLTDLTVKGGSVKAYGGAYAPGVGGANTSATQGGISLLGSDGVTVTMGSLEAFGAEGRYGIGPGKRDFFSPESESYYGRYTASASVNVVMTGTTGVETGSLVDKGSQVCASRYIRVIGARNLTKDMSEIGHGFWYLAQGNISREATISVNDSAHLVLWDGCNLNVTGGNYQAGVTVAPGNLLEILGGVTGSGKLTAKGSKYGAGIGGGYDENGGGIVTISGGMVTAQGGMYGAGIGGGFGGAGGKVTITGGAVIARAGEVATDIGRGAVGASDGLIEITGGIFGMNLPASWIPEGYAVLENLDDKTRSSYKWAVFPPATVTLEGGLPPNLAATWTSDGSTVETPISGESFKVPTGTMGVKVIFTPEHNYRFVGENETGVRELASPLKENCTVTPPEVEAIPGTVINPWNVGEGVTAYVSDEKTLVVGGEGKATALPKGFDRNSITSAVVGDGITEVDEAFFYKCRKLNTVTLGNDVTKVGENTFYLCLSLEKIRVSNPNVLESLANAIVYRASFDDKGEPCVIPEIEAPGYANVLYATDSLTNPNWQKVDKITWRAGTGKTTFFKYVFESVEIAR